MSKQNNSDSQTPKEGPKLFASSILQNVDIQKLKPGTGKDNPKKPENNATEVSEPQPGVSHINKDGKGPKLFASSVLQNVDLPNLKHGTGKDSNSKSQTPATEVKETQPGVSPISKDGKGQKLFPNSDNVETPKVKHGETSKDNPTKPEKPQTISETKPGVAPISKDGKGPKLFASSVLQHVDLPNLKHGSGKDNKEKPQTPSTEVKETQPGFPTISKEGKGQKLFPNSENVETPKVKHGETSKDNPTKTEKPPTISDTKPGVPPISKDGKGHKLFASSVLQHVDVPNLKPGTGKDNREKPETPSTGVKETQPGVPPISKDGKGPKLFASSLLQHVDLPNLKHGTGNDNDTKPQKAATEVKEAQPISKDSKGQKVFPNSDNVDTPKLQHGTSKDNPTKKIEKNATEMKETLPAVPPISKDGKDHKSFPNSDNNVEAPKLKHSTATGRNIPTMPEKNGPEVSETEPRAPSISKDDKGHKLFPNSDNLDTPKLQHETVKDNPTKKTEKNATEMKETQPGAPSISKDGKGQKLFPNSDDFDTPKLKHSTERDKSTKLEKNGPEASEAEPRAPSISKDGKGTKLFPNSDDLDATKLKHGAGRDHPTKPKMNPTENKPGVSHISKEGKDDKLVPISGHKNFDALKFKPRTGRSVNDDDHISKDGKGHKLFPNSDNVDAPKLKHGTGKDHPAKPEMNATEEKKNEPGVSHISKDGKGHKLFPNSDNVDTPKLQHGTSKDHHTKPEKNATEIKETPPAVPPISKDGKGHKLFPNSDNVDAPKLKHGTGRDHSRKPEVNATEVNENEPGVSPISKEGKDGKLLPISGHKNFDALKFKQRTPTGRSMPQKSVLEKNEIANPGASPTINDKDNSNSSTPVLQNVEPTKLNDNYPSKDVPSKPQANPAQLHTVQSDILPRSYEEGPELFNENLLNTNPDVSAINNKDPSTVKSKAEPLLSTNSDPTDKHKTGLTNELKQASPTEESSHLGINDMPNNLMPQNNPPTKTKANSTANPAPQTNNKAPPPNQNLNKNAKDPPPPPSAPQQDPKNETNNNPKDNPKQDPPKNGAEPSKSKPDTTPSKSAPKNSNKPKRGCCKRSKKPQKDDKGQAKRKRLNKEDCCNKACVGLWVLFIIGLCFPLHLAFDKCQVDFSFSTREIIFLNIALIFTYAFLAYVLLFCLIFICCIKLGARKKCCGICKEIIIGIHILAGVSIAVFIYTIKRKVPYHRPEKECLKTCLIYILIMLILGVIAYVIFSLAYRKNRCRVQPSRRYLERFGPCVSSGQMRSQFTTFDTYNTMYRLNTPCPCLPDANYNYSSRYASTTSSRYQSSGYKVRPASCDPSCQQELPRTRQQGRQHVFVNVFSVRPF